MEKRRDISSGEAEALPKSAKNRPAAPGFEDVGDYGARSTPTKDSS
jgi:hypothetical protein